MPEPVNFWGMHFADWLSLLPSLAAAYAVFAAWRTQPRWLMYRRRYKTLRPFGISRRATLLRVNQLLKNEPTTAAEELDWLSRVHAEIHKLPKDGADSATAITFSAAAPKLRGLSKAYASYAARLSRGSFLRTTAVPVVERDAHVAMEMTSLLLSAALGGGSETPCNCRQVQLMPSRERSLVLWQLPDLVAGTLAYDLLVSYRQHRLLADYSDADPAWESAVLNSPSSGHTALPLTPEESQHLRQQFASPRTFDSVLPRIVDWRAERDRSSGRLRLHLALAETTYAAVLTDHYPATFAGIPTVEGQAARTVNGKQAKLLTLSTVLISKNRGLLFAGRSKNVGSHPSQFGPAVNGNLEITPRHGIQPDSAATGVPNPLLALAREAREELGLVLPAEDIQVIGLGKFSVPSERGTHVLLTMARIPMSGDELAERTVDANPMEGRWELGGELLEAPLPEHASDVEPLLSWLLHNPELTPHSTLTGIAAVARHFPVTPGQLERIAADPTDLGFSPRHIKFKY